MSKNQVVPRYNFISPITDEAVTAYASYRLDVARTTIPEDLPHSPLRRDQIRDMQLGILALGESVGVDLSQRIIQEDDIHFFDRDRYEELKQRYPEQLGAGIPAVIGARLPASREAAVLEQNNEANTLAVAQHEMLHLFAHDERAIFMRDGKTIVSQTRTGYHVASNGAHRSLNEWVTEKANQRIMRYWNAYPTLRGIKPYQGDLAEMGYISAAVQTAAERLRFPLPWLENELIRGYFTGETEGLDAVVTHGAWDVHEIAFSWVQPPKSEGSSQSVRVNS